MIDTAPMYSHKVFEAPNLAKVAKWVARIAKREHFDALAGSGHSGLLLIGAASCLSGIPAIAVRKPGDVGHDCSMVHGVVPVATLRYAFVDDCVATGATMRNVIAEIAKVAPHAELCAVLTYSSPCGAIDVEMAKLNPDRVKRFHFASLRALS